MPLLTPLTGRGVPSEADSDFLLQSTEGDAPPRPGQPWVLSSLFPLSQRPPWARGEPSCIKIWGLSSRDKLMLGAWARFPRPPRTASGVSPAREAENVTFSPWLSRG